MPLKYIRDSKRYFIGVPARDLSDSEIKSAEALGYSESTLIASGAYIRPGPEIESQTIAGAKPGKKSNKKGNRKWQQ